MKNPRNTLAATQKIATGEVKGVNCPSEARKAMMNAERKKAIDLIGFISFGVHFETAIPLAAIIGDTAQSVAVIKQTIKPHKGMKASVIYQDIRLNGFFAVKIPALCPAGIRPAILE